MKARPVHLLFIADQMVCECRLGEQHVQLVPEQLLTLGRPDPGHVMNSPYVPYIA